MYTKVNKQSATPMTALTSPCPFAKWGIDILGPFPPVNGNKKFVLVVIDYFTIWVKVEALATIITNKLISFL